MKLDNFPFTDYYTDTASYLQHYKEYGMQVLNHLKANDISEIIVVGYPDEEGNVEELWKIPSEFDPITQYHEAETSEIKIGYLALGRIHGIHCVLEQYNSPIGVLINKKYLEELENVVSNRF
jgi:hypothetical protein